jgi:hypothetical protein
MEYALHHFSRFSMIFPQRMAPSGARHTSPERSRSKEVKDLLIKGTHGPMGWKILWENRECHGQKNI